METLPGSMKKNIECSNRVLVFVLSVTLLLCQFTYAKQQVSQFGITWTFDRDYIVGQFANGDYWVVGPVTIIGIDPPSVEIDGRVINGSMVNPSPRLGKVQGYDSTIYGNYARVGDYDPNLNVARPNGLALTISNPLILQPNCSVVSTISTPETDGSTQLKTAAVLTVLDRRAPEGSFRPPYAGTDKTIKFNKNQLKYSLLASLKPVPGPPSLTEVERYFERPWLDHIPSWLGRYQHPVDNMPDYGREIATQVGIAALMLNLNFTSQDKETLLIRFVQLGIDLYGIIQDGGRNNWVNNGGHASGRKFPILFAGLVLDNPDMKNIGEKSGDYLYSEGYGPGNEPPDYIHFGEDDQTFYVTQADVDITHSPQWRTDSRDAQQIPYETKDIGLPEWGIVHANRPESCNKYWGAYYRQCCVANAWAGFILAAHIMEESASAWTLWNHQALFDYQDRYMQVEGQWRRTSRFVEAMWDAYRAEYDPVWTMSPALNIQVTGGSVTKNPDWADYSLGDKVILNVVADAGYEFAGWSGDLTGTENPVTIIMYAHYSIVANFTIRNNLSVQCNSR